MNYRTHNCGELSLVNVNNPVKLAGWMHNKRDHGGLLFIDLRDDFGITQVVVEGGGQIEHLHKLKLESVISINGTVRPRPAGTVNAGLATGEIEILLTDFTVESEAKQIPFQINFDDGCNEDVRLTYRFLDLRRAGLHKNIKLRSNVTSYIRRRMEEAGFMEFQTPILTASSPEGARDFLVPSRLHPGKFYALPQAPQQFKQLLMVSGFDKYFQIAPCFRDEDARADRSPGEFYQLDIEMSFATQEDVFAAIEPVMYDIFVKFGGGKTVSQTPFRRIKYDESMDKYGSDKPDLRNPIINTNATEAFKGSDFGIFARAIENGSVVYAIPTPHVADKPRKFFDDMIKFAMDNGAGGLAYIIFETKTQAKSPIAKFLNPQRLEQIYETAGLKDGDAVFFVCEPLLKAQKLAGMVRTELGKRLELIDKNHFEFCWITDFPYYELDENTGKVVFSHNPFSMPQGGLDALRMTDPSFLVKYSSDEAELEQVFADFEPLDPNQFKTQSEKIKFLKDKLKDYPFVVFIKKDEFAKLSTRLQEVMNRDWNEDGEMIKAAREFGYKMPSKRIMDGKGYSNALVFTSNKEEAEKFFELFMSIKTDPLEIKAYQYDIVCNGVELSSGAIRNHKLEVLYKAFEIAGYSREAVGSEFAGMVKAFSYGAPPHGGIAPGIDRIVMLLAGAETIRDVIAFPLNGKAEDLLMNAPNTVSDKQLKDVHIKLNLDDE